MARANAFAGQIVNRAELASFLAYALPTIDKMVAAGCPILSREGSGKSSEFNTADVVKWLLARAEDAVRAEFDPEKGRTEESRRRFTAAAAELKELQLAERRKSMIRVEDVAPIIEDELANVRSRLLSLPGRLAPMCVGLDQATMEQKMRDEVFGALGELTQ